MQFIIFLAILLPATPLHDHLSSQSPVQNRMFIYDIAGHTYVKKDFNGDSSLTGYQQFQIGGLQKSDSLLRVPVRVRTYNREGKMTDSLETQYICKPEVQTVLLNIITLMPSGGQKTITISRHGKGIIFPAATNTQKRLSNLSFTMELKGGVIGFLGGKTKLAVTNRKITRIDSVSYKYSSEISLSVYVLGIRVKQLVYYAEERLDTRHGLTRQILRNKGGSYSIIQIEG